MNYKILFADKEDKKKGKDRVGLNLTYFDEINKDTDSYLPPNVPKHSSSLSLELICPNISIIDNPPQEPPQFLSPSAQINTW